MHLSLSPSTGKLVSSLKISLQQSVTSSLHLTCWGDRSSKMNGPLLLCISASFLPVLRQRWLKIHFLVEKFTGMQDQEYNKGGSVSYSTIVQCNSFIISVWESQLPHNIHWLTSLCALVSTPTHHSLPLPNGYFTSPVLPPSCPRCRQTPHIHILLLFTSPHPHPPVQVPQLAPPGDLQAVQRGQVQQTTALQIPTQLLRLQWTTPLIQCPSRHQAAATPLSTGARHLRLPTTTDTKELCSYPTAITYTQSDYHMICIFYFYAISHYDSPLNPYYSICKGNSGYIRKNYLSIFGCDGHPRPP